MRSGLRSRVESGATTGRLFGLLLCAGAQIASRAKEIIVSQMRPPDDSTTMLESTTRQIPRNLPIAKIGSLHESTRQVFVDSTARAAACDVFSVDRAGKQCVGAGRARIHPAGTRSDAGADRAVPGRAAVADHDGSDLSPRGRRGRTLVRGQSQPQGYPGRAGGRAEQLGSKR